MTERTPRSLAHEACILASLCEGLSVLDNEADQLPDETQCQISRRAHNSLTATIDVVIERAWALTSALEKLETEQRKEK